MKYNTIYMEAWSRRLMTHHAHPLLAPQCAARKIGRRKYRRTPLIAVAQRSLNVSLAMKSRAAENELGLVNFTVALTLFCRLRRQ